jgi:hypothetical protein
MGVDEHGPFFNERKSFDEVVRPMMWAFIEKCAEFNMPVLVAVCFSNEYEDEKSSRAGVAQGGNGRDGWAPNAFYAMRAIADDPDLADVVLKMVMLGEAISGGGREGKVKDAKVWTEEDYKSMNDGSSPEDHYHYNNLPCVGCKHTWGNHRKGCAGECSVRGCKCQHFVHMGDDEEETKSEPEAEPEVGEVKQEVAEIKEDEEKLQPFWDFLSDKL